MPLFDPQELLRKVSFPNDRLETVIKRSRHARWNAIRKKRIDEEDTEWHEPKAIIVTKKLQTLAGTLTTESKSDEQAIQEEKNYILRRIQLSKYAASIVLQSIFRTWVIRKKYIRVISFRLSLITRRDHRLSDNQLPPLHLTVQERLLNKYARYCDYEEKQKQPLPDYPWFCSALISAQWKGYTTRKTYLEYKKRKMEQKDAEKAIQWIQHKMNGVGFKRMSQDQAAQKIQRCWRSYYNLRVYHFYRDLIRFREQGDPKSLLRFINPRESTLVEKSMGIHMRFRLGGEKFPPVIFYKIYVDRKLVDMNAFSPRDYTLSDTKMVDPVHLFNKTAWKPGKYEEWYQRFENNEWRPVLDSILINLESNTQTADKHTKRFHYSFEKRQEKVKERKEARQKQWLDKIDHFFRETEEIEWAEKLDFDAYQKTWSLIATTSQFETS